MTGFLKGEKASTKQSKILPFFLRWKASARVVLNITKQRWSRSLTSQAETGLRQWFVMALGT